MGQTTFFVVCRFEGMTIFTVGHSTHPADEFLRILRVYEIELLADIRTVPRSRKNPQFDQHAFERLLEKERIAYRHLAGLGGLRHARKDSRNTGWKNASFRGYADYMQTPEFARALEELIDLAAEQTTAIMCAEAVPWRCHRSLVGDALLARAIDVQDIFSGTQVRAHKMTPFAKVHGLDVTYP
ncbi:MAG TPA: DUF488 domain-containing protein [Bryobacteraceae bacterium]